MWSKLVRFEYQHRAQKKENGDRRNSVQKRIKAGEILQSGYDFFGKKVERDTP